MVGYLSYLSGFDLILFSQYFLSDERVSKQHLRIYSVIFDPDKTSEIPAMVYCEDLESTNGTYVNDRLIGIFGRERFPYLLSDGDVIEIRPKWKFHFSQKRQPKEERETEISRDEVQEENLKVLMRTWVNHHSADCRAVLCISICRLGPHSRQQSMQGVSS